MPEALKKHVATSESSKPYGQLASFAPSKQDILQTLEFFFGQPAQPEKLQDFSEHHAATCTPQSLP